MRTSSHPVRVTATLVVLLAVCVPSGVDAARPALSFRRADAPPSSTALQPVESAAPPPVDTAAPTTSPASAEASAPTSVAAATETSEPSSLWPRFLFVLALVAIVLGIVMLLRRRGGKRAQLRWSDRLRIVLEQIARASLQVAATDAAAMPLVAQSNAERLGELGQALAQMQQGASAAQDQQVLEQVLDELLMLHATLHELTINATAPLGGSARQQATLLNSLATAAPSRLGIEPSRPRM